MNSLRRSFLNADDSDEGKLAITNVYLFLQDHFVEFVENEDTLKEAIDQIFKNSDQD